MKILKKDFYKKIYDINIYIMKWIDGLKEFNKTKKYKNWVVPKKGTNSYKTVMEMIKPVTIKPMMSTKIIK